MIDADWLSSILDSEAERRIVAALADRLGTDPPRDHPLYAAHMVGRVHPIAWAAYALAMAANPNNQSRDAGAATTLMEQEAVAAIARMVGWSEPLGHLTSGGTVGNLEALWVARELRPAGAPVLVCGEAHYNQARIAALLGMPCDTLPCDSLGRLDIGALARRLEAGAVGTVVATIGSTALGAVDALPELLALRERHGFRLHADAAYGGYHGLIDTLDGDTRAAYERLAEVDSIVIDPHKHGLQPLGCGCVLFRDAAAAGRVLHHRSHYTYFDEAAEHLGRIGLECSRPGAAAAALWATLRLLPLERGGAFAQRLEKSRSAALALHGRLLADDRFVAGPRPALDIVAWLPRAAGLDEASARSRERFHAAAARGLHLALAELPARCFGLRGERVTALRATLMKPEHADSIDALWALIDETEGTPLRRQ